jgi:hypothetical protein
MYFGLKAKFYLAYAYNYKGEAVLSQDECGAGIRSLKESQKCYSEAIELAKEYAKTKGPGTQARPEQHAFFRRLAPIVTRTLEKCERENGFIYHQKVPYDPPDLEIKDKTFGLVSPEEYSLPPTAPLWTPVAYAAFDVALDNDKAKSEKEKKNVFELLTKQAEKIKPGSDGLMYFPYLGNTLSPNWNSSATGMFFGIRPTTSKAHFIRSVIEGVAFDCNSNVKIAKEAGAKIDKFTLNGGPTKSRFWNQITSDVTGLPLDLPDVGKSEESGFPPEAAPLGDAILAAVGAGFYSNPLESLSDIVKVKEVFEPNKSNHEMYSDFFEVWRSIYHNLLDDMSKHHELLNKHNFS